MATVDLIMPKMGESIMEATILKWHKGTGDSIKMDETLLDIATDKVDSEVPSTAEGVVEEMLFAVNDVVPIGAVIARIRTGGEQKHQDGGMRSEEGGKQTNIEQGTGNDEVKQQQAASKQFAGNDFAQAVQKSNAGSNGGASTDNTSGARFFSPLVLNIAAQEGVRLSELENIKGTGNEGRITKRDILQYVSEKKASKDSDAGMTVGNQPLNTEQRLTTNDQPTVNRQMSTVNADVPATSDQRPASYSGNVEIIEMDRMRRLIADHMVRSKHTSPHVTSFTEADVTNLVMWREKVKGEFEKREGTKITFTPLFIEAIVRCIKKFPLINSSLDGTNIIVKKDINIGMATALPTGNLIVPVIKNADG
jgi:2-oxoglutarate dehydrogenase E2 component (dihydrolipoamide succinyltransferase)